MWENRTPLARSAGERIADLPTLLWEWRDLDSQPAGLQPVALPIALHSRVGEDRIELSTFRFLNRFISRTSRLISRMLRR